MSIDETGAVNWSIKLGTDSDTDTCKDIIEANNAVYFVADSRSFSASFSIVLGKVSTSGNLEWA